MRDADVRSALATRIRDWHPESDALVVEELDLLGEVRVDVAVQLLPRWWQIVVAAGDSGSVVTERLRPGTRNPAVDPEALVQLLWRDEAIDLLRARGLDRGVRSKPRRHAWARLVECLELDELRTEVRRQLKARRGWRGSGSRG